jgi:hypothetical protein
MDFLLIILVLWGVYSIYRNIMTGSYNYVVYLIIIYFVLGLLIKGPKWRIFLSIILTNLLTTCFMISNMFSIISGLNKI